MSGERHLWVGKAYSKLGRNAEAAQAVARAALLDPRNLQYQREAVLAAQRAGDPENLFARGFALQMTGDLEAAMRDYRKVLETSPTNVQVTFNLAYALMALGRGAESVPLFRRVLELKPGYAEARVHLASCYEKIGDAGSARRERSAYPPAVGASH